MLPKSADVVVVGAGIMGLSVAYHLAREQGVRNVCVLDASYLCGGASGRNGGGVRAQWSNERNIRLMRQSLELFRDFAREHRINTWFRQGGYLFLTRSTEQAEALAESVELQKRAGLSTELVQPDDLRRIVPELNPDGVVLASYNPDDAVVFPWPFVWGYAQGATALGVSVHPFSRVVGIDVEQGRVVRVRTERGDVATHLVLNACGAHSPTLARLVGVELPTRPHRHEICASEPLKPWLVPLVADLSNGLYFSQSMRGELVGGISNERVPPGPTQASSARFLTLYARALSRLCPVLGSLKILRQWAGLYDLSPDAAPVVGPVENVEGFWHSSGFMGHGFMMAPVVGRLLAQSIAQGALVPDLADWTLGRFKHGVKNAERMIIG